jgi:hypothetical protein
MGKADLLTGDEGDNFVARYGAEPTNVKMHDAIIESH